MSLHLNLSVPTLEKCNAQQDALLKHTVVLGADDQVDHQL